MEIKAGRGWLISFIQDDTLRDPSGFRPTVIHEEKNCQIILLVYYHLIIFSSKLIELKQ